MRSIDESVKELKTQMAKLDHLINMGEAFVHMINTAVDGHSIDELPSDLQEGYLDILKNIAESRALKKDLEIMLYAVESISNKIPSHEVDEGREVNENE